MALIPTPSTWEMTGTPGGALVSFGGPTQKVILTAKAACVVRCLPRKSGDTAATAPAATPVLSAGNLELGWVSLAANDRMTFGPLRDEGVKAFFELEIWELAAGKLVIEVAQ